MTERIEVHNVFKKYGKKVALSGVSLSFERGKIYGVFGPNGMGKTTLLKVIAGILRPTTGSVLLKNGENELDRRMFISYSPEDGGLYENMRVKDFLDFISHIFYSWSKERESQLVELLDIPLEERIDRLSRGYKARLRVLSALSKKAVFYLLDEPFSGIDPTSRHRIKNAISEYLREGAALIITSHLIGEIESLFDFVYFIDRGEIVLSGDAEELRKQHGTSIEGIYINTFR